MMIYSGFYYFCLLNNAIEKMNKGLRILPILFFVLFLSGIATGFHSYHSTKNAIVNDLNKALAQSLSEENNGWVTTDTIRAYKQLKSCTNGEVYMAIADERFSKRLSIEKLRDMAYITFDISGYDTSFSNQQSEVICSDTMIIRNKILNENLAFRSYAQCSAFTIFSMSEQRTSLSFIIASIICGIIYIMNARRRRNELEGMLEFGGLYMSASDNRFYDMKNCEIHLTPMQQQLMKMFYSSSTHSLTKSEICSALWPKKDDADETLYTLIRRIKPVIEEHSLLKIESDRGKSYSLKIK